MSVTHGTIWWSELMTRDAAAALKYYGALCGWTWERMGMGESGYHVANAHGKPVAGVMDISGMPGMEAAPVGWFTYIAVDDVDAAARATETGGGKVLRQPFEVPGIGRIAILQDPSGAAVGMMTPASSPASPPASQPDQPEDGRGDGTSISAP